MFQQPLHYSSPKKPEQPTDNQVSQPAEEEIKKYLENLASDYVLKTESYSKMICTGRVIDGVAQPATSIEVKMVNQHTRKMLDRAKQQAAEAYCLGASAVTKAIQDHNLRTKR